MRLRAEVIAVHGAGRLEALTVRDGLTEEAETLPAGALFILIGAEPHTDWLAAAVERDDRGFLLTGHNLLHDPQSLRAWPLDRPPLLLETSLPGVFAAGDVRHGSVKRVASAVGEGAIAIQLVHQYLNDAAPAWPPNPAGATGHPLALWFERRTSDHHTRRATDQPRLDRVRVALVIRVASLRRWPPSPTWSASRPSGPTCSHRR